MLTVIIVSFNTCQNTLFCLEKVRKAQEFAGIRTQIIVVDNGSKDNTIEKIRKKMPEVEIIQNSKNCGFAFANNQGLKSARHENILLLNSDCFLERDALKIMLHRFKEDPETGAMGIKLVNSDRSLQYSFGFEPDLARIFFWWFFLDDIPFIRNLIKSYHDGISGNYKKEKYVFWVSGACLLLRKGAVSKAGLFDERIFMYAEEVEWFFRLKKAGYRTLFYPLASAVHLGGASQETASIKRYILEVRGLYYIYKKHKSVIKVKIFKYLIRAGAFLRIFVFGIIGRDTKKKEAYEKIIKEI